MEDSIATHQSQPVLDDTPKVPPAPVLSLGAFFGFGENRSNILDNGEALYFTSGRMAVSKALELGQIAEGNEVLLPAYHCSSMVTPITHNKGKPVFYKIKPDLSIDLQDLEKKLTGNTRAIIATHYFGFAQNLPSIRAFCDKNDLLLIEDCAHSFFGSVSSQPIGSYGDFTAGSLMKFFPTFDGGCLISKQHDLSKILLRSGGKGFELQSLINTLEKSFTYGRLPLLKWILFLPFVFKEYVWNKIKINRKNRGKPIMHAPAASGGGFDFDPKWTNTRISATSKILVHILSKSVICEKRRQNYTILANLLSGYDDFYPLRQLLDQNTVPYAFPLIVEKPDPGFYSLRAKGVPLMRWEHLWDGVDETICSTSSRYSSHLVQIPCHQELTSKELEWMARKIKEEYSS